MIRRWSVFFSAASLLALALLAPAAAGAQHVPMYVPKHDAAADAADASRRAAAIAAAPRVAARYGLAPLAHLASSATAATAELEALRAWNEARHRPLHNGFARTLPAPQRVALTAQLAAKPMSELAGGLLVQTSLSTVAWGGSVHVDNAYRLRLHLSHVSLPAGAQLWVHGTTQSVGPFGREMLAPDGTLWTPSVVGDEVALDVEMPAAALAASSGAAYGFTVDQVLELVDTGHLDAGVVTAKDDSCFIDATCEGPSSFTGYAAARHAVAIIEFVDSGQGGQCTGQLLNDLAQDETPYMLTANHCIATAAGARTLQAWYDYYTPSCNGPAPDMFSLPTSNGATLLATGDANTSSDFTLMQLDAIPAGRSFLGWNSLASAVPNGTLMYRLSHGNGEPQSYNVTSVDFGLDQCVSADFLYSDLVTGGTFDGSSGSAAMLADGSVVGQLYGGCGSDNDCSPAQWTVDGAFSHSFPALQPYLEPTGDTPFTCTPNATTLCLLDNRFQVRVTYTNQFDNSSGTGMAIHGTDNTGYFYFFDPTNYELIVKILNLDDVIKVFYGELTDLEFTITVADSLTGTVKTYTNTAGDCGAIDEDAFPAASGNATKSAEIGRAGIPAQRGTCVPGHGTLCLLDRRFAITTTWMNQFNDTSGTGQSVSLSDQSGYFTFTDPTTVELVMKVVPFADRVAFYYGSLSDYQYTIKVVDTIGGTTKTYVNPAGTYCGGLDNSAFPP
jgi:hypothetical protein